MAPDRVAPRKDIKPTSVLGSIAKVLALAVLASLIWIEAGTIIDLCVPFISLGLTLLLLAVLLALPAALSTLTTIRLWGHPLRRKALGAVRFLFLLSSVVTLLEMAILTSYFLWASDIYRMTVAAEDFDNGIVQSLGDGRVAFVGSIGPTLMRDLATVETQNGSFRVLEITSDGGLMDQALLLAQEVETRRISVVVRARCLSACVAVAVASPESYAESGAIFGFHRTALVADAVSEITQIEGQQFNQLYFDFLRQHGVPEALLQQGIERGADEIYEVPAAEMVDAGAIKGLISGERVIRIGPKM